VSFHLNPNAGSIVHMKRIWCGTIW